MDAEFAERKRQRHAKSDERIAASEQHQAELLIESRRHRELWRLDQMDERKERDRVELSWRQSHRDWLMQLRGSLGPLEQEHLADEISGAFDDSANPVVQHLASSLRAIWTAEQIDVRECADPRLANGSASRSGRWIAIGPLKNIRLCEIAWHETAHICHGELADYREVLADDKFHKISVPAEIASWRWVLDRITYWDEAMHEDMTRFIGSYKSHAIESEIREIVTLCSPLTLSKTRLRIAAA